MTSISQRRRHVASAHWWEIAADDMRQVNARMPSECGT